MRPPRRRNTSNQRQSGINRDQEECLCLSFMGPACLRSDQTRPRALVDPPPQPFALVILRMITIAPSWDNEAHPHQSFLGSCEVRKSSVDSGGANSAGSAAPSATRVMGPTYRLREIMMSGGRGGHRVCSNKEVTICGEGNMMRSQTLVADERAKQGIQAPDGSQRRPLWGGRTGATGPGGASRAGAPAGRATGRGRRP